MSQDNDHRLETFLDLRATRVPHRVLEVGTKRSIADRATHHMHHFPGVARTNYVMCDVDNGIDVDVVCDIHSLPKDWTNSFDAFFSIAVFEHLRRPWIAAKEIERILRKGGICYVGTHQTYPLHGFPNDYFRFSKEALAGIFEDAGLKVIEADYKHRTKIVPEPHMLDPAMLDAWNEGQPSWLYVDLVAEKL